MRYSSEWRRVGVCSHLSIIAAHHQLATEWGNRWRRVKCVLVVVKHRPHPHFDHAQRSLARKRTDGGGKVWNVRFVVVSLCLLTVSRKFTLESHCWTVHQTSRGASACPSYLHVQIITDNSLKDAAAVMAPKIDENGIGWTNMRYGAKRDGQCRMYKERAKMKWRWVALTRAKWSIDSLVVQFASDQLVCSRVLSAASADEAQSVALVVRVRP